VPVYWAIQAGKAKDGVDFTANTVPVPCLFPAHFFLTYLLWKYWPTPSGTVSASAQNYSAGPFIIDSVYAATAAPIICKNFTCELIHSNSFCLHKQRPGRVAITV